MNKAQTIVFNIIKRKNPQVANALQQCINNGENPKQVLSQLIEANQVSRNDVQQIRNNLGAINRFLGMNLTQNDISQLDAMFDNKNNGFRF